MIITILLIDFHKSTDDFKNVYNIVLRERNNKGEKRERNEKRRENMNNITPPTI
jgi:hypothetical protein